RVLGVVGVLLIAAAAGFWWLNQQQRTELNQRLAAYWLSEATNKLEQDSIPLAYRLNRAAEELVPGTGQAHLEEILPRVHFGRFPGFNNYVYRDSLLLATREVAGNKQLFFQNVATGEQQVLANVNTVFRNQSGFGFLPDGEHVFWFGAPQTSLYLKKVTGLGEGEVTRLPLDVGAAFSNELQTAIWRTDGRQVVVHLQPQYADSVLLRSWVKTMDGTWEEIHLFTFPKIEIPLVLATPENKLYLNKDVYGGLSIREITREGLSSPSDNLATFTSSLREIRSLPRDLVSIQSGDGGVILVPADPPYAYPYTDMTLYQDYGGFYQIRYGDTTRFYRYLSAKNTLAYAEFRPDGPYENIVDLPAKNSLPQPWEEGFNPSLQVSADGKTVAIWYEPGTIAIIENTQSPTALLRTITLPPPLTVVHSLYTDINSIFSFGPGTSYFLRSDGRRFSWYPDYHQSYRTNVLADSLGEAVHFAASQNLLYAWDTTSLRVFALEKDQATVVDSVPTPPDFRWNVNLTTGKEGGSAVLVAYPEYNSQAWNRGRFYCYRYPYTILPVQTDGEKDLTIPEFLLSGYFLATVRSPNFEYETQLLRFPPAGQTMEEMLAQDPTYTTWRPGEKARYGIQ
ncbi:MAG: hypothetical protein AAFZ52_16325, partial [Bacteroidota bacterium]